MSNDNDNKTGVNGPSLLDSEIDFVNEYMSNGFNAAKAYRAIKPGCTESSVATNAYRVKNRPHVLAEIRRRMEERVGDKEVLAMELLDKLKSMAHAEKSDEYYTPAVSLKAIDLLQKQLNLITNNVSMTGDLNFVINVGGDDGDESSDD